MAINNTISNTFSPLKPNPVVSPFAPPKQNALTNKVGGSTPSWQSTLSQVQSSPNWNTPLSSGPVNPARPNQTMTALPANTGQTAVKGVLTAPIGSTASTQPPQVNFTGGGVANGGLGTQSTQGTQPPNQGTVSNTVVPPTPNPVTYPGLVGGLASFNPLNNPQVSGAYQKAQDINEQIAQSKQNLAKNLAGNATDPVDLTFQTGRARVMTDQALAQQNALSSELQGQSGLYSAGLQGTGQQLSGLNSAAGLASPRQQGYVMIDPLTGQPVGGQGGLNSAITQGAGYDAKYQGALGAAQDNQAIQGAQNNIDSITQLIQSSGLNKSGINIENATIQALQKNLSNSDYQTLRNSLQAINAALSKVTGTPVDIEQLATSQGTSLITTINNAVQSAKGIAAGKSPGGSTSTGGSGSSSGSYTSNSGNTYNLPY